MKMSRLVCFSRNFLSAKAALEWRQVKMLQLMRVEVSFAINLRLAVCALEELHFAMFPHVIAQNEARAAGFIAKVTNEDFLRLLNDLSMTQLVNDEEIFVLERLLALCALKRGSR